MEKSTGIILGIVVIGGAALLLLKKSPAAATTTTTGTSGTSAADLAKIMADTQSKLDAAAKLAASGDNAGASKAAQDAATVAMAAGNIDAASKAAVAAAAYADQTSQVAAATAALKTNTYVEATKATVAANVSTAFEIANSGLGGSAAVGKTITVKGVDGTKTMINTGNGYAEYTPALKAAVSTVSTIPTSTLKNAIISAGFAKAAQISAMSDAQFETYSAIVVANNPSLVKTSTTTTVTSQVASNPATVVPATSNLIAVHTPSGIQYWDGSKYV